MRSSEVRSNVCMLRGMIGTVHRGSRRSQCALLKQEYTGVDLPICSIYTPATCGHCWLLFVRSSPTGRMDKIRPNTLAEMVTLLMVPSSNLLNTKLIIVSVVRFSVCPHTQRQKVIVDLWRH